MIPISNNHWSHDQQVSDALDWLMNFQPEAYESVRKNFPETIVFEYDSSYFDTELMGVDPEYSSWLCDAIESTGFVIWEDGEPFAIVNEEK